MQDRKTRKNRYQKPLETAIPILKSFGSEANRLRFRSGHAKMGGREDLTITLLIEEGERHAHLRSFTTVADVYRL